MASLVCIHISGDEREHENQAIIWRNAMEKATFGIDENLNYHLKAGSRYASFR
jgi:hypothetical protein